MRSITMTNVTCFGCGVIFQRALSKHTYNEKEGRVEYCSRKCKAEDERNEQARLRANKTRT